MGRYQIKAPDGHDYEIEAPDDATPQQLEAAAREVSGYAKDYPVTPPPKAESHPVFPTTPALDNAADQVGSNLENDLAGIGQGIAALPDLAAKGVGKVLSVVPTAIGYGLDKFGTRNLSDLVTDHSPGQAWHDAARQLANPFQIGNVIESVSPTPDTRSGKVNRFIGNLVGGAVGFPGSAADNIVAKVVGEVPNGFVSPASTVAKVAPNLVNDAEQAGVRVLTSDVRPPKTFMGKFAQATGEKVPITGTASVRAAQQTERVAAIKNIAQDYGAANGDELASPAIDAVAKDLATRRGATITNLTNAKNAVIGKIQGAVPVTNASQAIDHEISKLESTGLNSYTPVIAKLHNWQQALQGKDLQTVEMLRKQIGEDFSAPDMTAVRKVAQKALSNIYGPLREDMGSFIKANGEPGDFTKWQRANDTLAGMVGDLKNVALKRSLRNAESTPEDVASLLFSQKPSDVRLLYTGLSPGGRAKAQAAILQRAVEKAGGLENISPERFATQVNSLGKSVGVFFEGKDLARIEGLTRVLKATQRASDAKLAPPTGVHAVPLMLGAGFDHFFGLAGGIAAAGGTGLIARAYETPVVRNLLLKLGQSKPGSRQEGVLIGRVGAAITAAVQKHGSAPNFLNDNISTVTGAAASPYGTDTQSQQQ
jgi:hypothetical protein